MTLVKIRKKKKKAKKKIKTTFVFFVEINILILPLKTRLCAMCAKDGLTRVVLTDSQHRWVLSVV